jgi:peroxiredoxin
MRVATTQEAGMGTTRRELVTGCLAAFIVAVRASGAETKTITVALQSDNTRQPAPDFALNDANGKSMRLSDFRGRVVLLDFWATTCGGCVEEIPGFIEVSKTYSRKGLATIGVSEDIPYANLSGPEEAWGRVKPFVQTHAMPYPVLMGNADVTTRYRIEALPLTYLIDSRGRVAAVYKGVVNRQNLEQNIAALLNER